MVANPDQADFDGDGYGDACSIGSILVRTMDESEPVADVPVILFDSTNNRIDSLVTDGDGAGVFPDLPFATYRVGAGTPPEDYRALRQQYLVYLVTEVDTVFISLEKMHIQADWRPRGKGFWMNLLHGWHHWKKNLKEIWLEMCDLIERIRIFINEHPEHPIAVLEIDEHANCNQRLKDLRDAIFPHRHQTIRDMARAHYIIMLLNLVSGRLHDSTHVVIRPRGGRSHDGNEVKPGNGNGRGHNNSPAVEQPILISQVVTYCGDLLTDDDPYNDSLVYEIAVRINEGQPIDDGLVDPSTPVYSYVPEDVASDNDQGEAELPGSFSLAQNYPNPFNPTTVIAYSLPSAGEVKLVVYNVIGQQVATLVDDEQPAGYYQVEWNGTADSGADAASGVYLYRISFNGNTSETRKMMLVK